MEKPISTLVAWRRKKVPAVIEAICRAGGLAPVARHCKVTIPAVWQWARKGRVPADRVLAVEALTGVSRYRLRPDIYGEAPEV